MENIINSVINIEFSNSKKEKESIINDIIKEKKISNFNASIKLLIGEENKVKPILINNPKIYSYFIYKYFYSRKLSYLLK